MPSAVLTFILALTLQAGGAKSLQPSAPQMVGKIDAGKLKGEPTQLAWSPDGSQFFLQTSERDSQAMVKNPRYYLLSGTDAKPTSISVMPDWAQEYWGWKSDKSPPGSKAMVIDIKRTERVGTATSSPMGGALARGGGTDANAGTTVEDVASRALQTQRDQVIILTLRNEVVGEFVNTQFLPGYSFGWAPQGSPMIAYRNQNGRLSIMDDRGQKQELQDTKDVLLPAWSGDGSKIAFLQRTAKNKYDLVVVDVKQ